MLVSSARFTDNLIDLAKRNCCGIPEETGTLGVRSCAVVDKQKYSGEVKFGSDFNKAVQVGAWGGDEMRKKDIDITEVKKGTSISGTPGVTTYKDDAALYAALRGDLSTGKTLTSGKAADVKLNQIEYGKALTQDLKNLLDRKGVIVDAVSAKGSLGIEAYGLGASANASTSSRDQTDVNVLYGAYTRGLDKALMEGQGRGKKTDAQIAADFNKSFASTIIKEAEAAKTILNPNKYAQGNKPAEWGDDSRGW